MVNLKPIFGLIAVELPDGAANIKTTFHKDGIIFYENDKAEQINLPPKTKWELIGESKNLKEDELVFIQTIGERTGFTGLRYMFPKYPDVSGENWINSRRGSFEYLLEANGLNKKNNYAILKQIK